jgi:hypothetical protein
MNHLNLASIEAILEDIDREHRHTVSIVKADANDVEAVKLLSLLNTAQAVLFKVKKELLK